MTIPKMPRPDWWMPDDIPEIPDGAKRDWNEEQRPKQPAQIPLYQEVIHDKPKHDIADDKKQTPEIN